MYLLRVYHEDSGSIVGVCRTLAEAKQWKRGIFVAARTKAANQPQRCGSYEPIRLMKCQPARRKAGEQP